MRIGVPLLPHNRHRAASMMGKSGLIWPVNGDDESGRDSAKPQGSFSL